LTDKINATEKLNAQHSKKGGLVWRKKGTNAALKLSKRAEMYWEKNEGPLDHQITSSRRGKKQVDRQGGGSLRLGRGNQCANSLRNWTGSKGEMRFCQASFRSVQGHQKGSKR